MHARDARPPMNPTRSAGVVIASGEFHALWVYIVAPIVGTSVGALGYQVVRGETSTRVAQQQPRPALAAGSGVGSRVVTGFVAFTIAPCIPSAASYGSPVEQIRRVDGMSGRPQLVRECDDAGGKSPIT